MEWFEFEKALRLLLSYSIEEEAKKPYIFHSVRVWTYLYNKIDILKKFKLLDYCMML